MKYVKFVMLLVLCSMLFTTLATAQERKDEWKDPNYDFTKLKTILIATSEVPDLQIDKYESRKLETFYNDVFCKTQKKWTNHAIIFITLSQLQEKVGAYTGLDMQQLAIDDPVRFKTLIKEYIPICTDAVLDVQVISFGYSRKFVDAYSYTYKTQKETEVETKFKDSNGKWVTGKKIIKEPVEKLVDVPAHYITYANAGMEYTLIDSKNNEAVWMLLDIRQARNKEPIDMIKRIIDRATKNLEKVF